MPGSVRALKAVPKLHNYDGTRNKNSDTQKYTHIKPYTHPKLTEEENDFKKFRQKINLKKKKGVKVIKKIL